MTAQNFPLGYPHAHGTSAEAPSTAADVLRAAIDTFLDDRPFTRMGPQQERAWLVDVLTAEAHKALAAAGLLATAEHDAERYADGYTDALRSTPPALLDERLRAMLVEHDREVAASVVAQFMQGHEPYGCTDNPWDPVQERCSSDEQAWPCDQARIADRIAAGEEP